MNNEHYISSEGKERSRHGLLFHHSRKLEHCFPHRVTQRRLHESEIPAEDIIFERSYHWLEKEVGFYPLFMAVGDTEEDIRMSGYQNQWKRLVVSGKDYKEYRQKGEVENNVLFSYKDLPGGVFMDYANWHLVLNSDYKDYQLTDREKRTIFRPSWNKADWLRFARKNPQYVQYVVPELDLTNADVISVRNAKTKRQLEQQGFTNVQVRRIKIET
jgi:hypothetical protein